MENRSQNIRPKKNRVGVGGFAQFPYWSQEYLVNKKGLPQGALCQFPNSSPVWSGSLPVHSQAGNRSTWIMPCPVKSSAFPSTLLTYWINRQLSSAIMKCLLRASIGALKKLSTSEVSGKSAPGLVVNTTPSGKLKIGASTHSDNWMDARHFLYSAEVTNLERPRVATGIQSWFVVGGNGN